MELVFLLMWGMLRSREVTGCGNGKCCAPHNIEFAEIIIDRILVGSKMRYECEDGYTRKVGERGLIECTNDTGVIHWTTKTSVCQVDTRATSQQSKRRTHSSAAGNPVTIMPSDTAGYCGMPRSIEHTRLKTIWYAVGQELHYKCLSGYDARPPTSDISICKDDGGTVSWTKLHLQCTNDSKSGEETLQPIPVTDTSVSSHVSSVKPAVTVVIPIVLLIIIILGGLLFQQRWARMRSTSEVKIEKTKPIQTAAARVEMESEEEIQRLKSNV
ncbi:interleukin-2 receptor subunit alpha-like isoform X2 [Emydura macquarii macquarii]|uniref:interleukin-2 receptor subunit alpha-like isoform X2 n=1 Tax=Emydura macquarii macquarii TaxID=1129001 RepID=UPI003529DD6A